MGGSPSCPYNQKSSPWLTPLQLCKSHWSSFCLDLFPFDYEVVPSVPASYQLTTWLRTVLKSFHPGLSIPFPAPYTPLYLGYSQMSQRRICLGAVLSRGLCQSPLCYLDLHMASHISTCPPLTPSCVFPFSFLVLIYLSTWDSSKCETHVTIG